MGAGAMAAIGAVGGFMSAMEARHQGKWWNKRVQDIAAGMNPKWVMMGAQRYNPFLWSALGMPSSQMLPGSEWMGKSQYAQQLAKLINNPGYIDPQLMNNSLTQIDRGQAAGLNRAQGMMGRSGMEGGLGAAFAMASQAGSTNSKANLMQQYVLFREQQRRSDLAMIQGMIQASIDTSSRNSETKANLLMNQKPVLGHMGVGANIIKGAMEGMSMGMGGTGSMDPNSLTGGFNAQRSQGTSYSGQRAISDTTGYNTGNDITPENNPMGTWGTASSTAAPTSGGISNGAGGMFGAAANGGALATTSSAPTVWGRGGGV